MIPIQLTIAGFLSYQDAVTINFEQFQLACISGPNGAGKSSILDAITWSLFGMARSRNDAIVNQNCEAAEVGFHFLYENQQYRIRRYKAKEKVQVLEVFKFDDENQQWRALTENSIHQTQNRIIAILRLDYDSFVHAAFFLQGKADSFTNLTPSRRKEILSSILGLEIWESYRDSVSLVLRQLELKENQISAILTEIELELSTETATLTALADLLKDEVRQQEIKQNLTQLITQARLLEQSFLNSSEQIKLFESDLQKRTQICDQKQMRITQLLTQLDALSKKLQNAQLIETNFLNWKSLRHELDGWEEKRERYTRLENEKNKLAHTIEVEKTSLETQTSTLKKEAHQIETQRRTIDQVKTDLELLEVAFKNLEEQRLDREILQNQLETIQREYTQNQSQIHNLTQLNDKLRKDLIEFQHAGPECPFCKQPLTASHREQYENQTTAEGVNRKTEIERLTKDQQANQTTIDELKSSLQYQQKIEREWQALNQKKTQLVATQNQLEKILTTWNEEKEPALTHLEMTLNTNAFALQARQELKYRLTEIAAVEYDSQKHQKAKTDEATLRASENQMRELQNAQAMIEPLKLQAEELEQEIEGISTEINEKQASLLQLKQQHAQQFKDIPNLAVLQKDLNEVQIKLNHLFTLIGGEKQKLAAIESKKVAKIGYEEEKATVRVAMARHEKLKEAFGKNGVPAWLIENALPRIEEHANVILDRLTNGEMTVRFETQGDYKDKKRSDKKETLEILINDVNGNTRAYEMFSGGEAFRINFAIRMALSRVLAHRSGAKLQTLVIDEGFGSQDAEGRQRVIEAVNLVRNDFAKILIITHLEELKDAFPARIDVEKSNHGSVVQVQVF